MSRNDALNRRFRAKFGERYARVRDYYSARKKAVVVQDVSPWVDGLASVAETDEPVI
jgi:hypothetical protein